MWFIRQAIVIFAVMATNIQVAMNTERLHLGAGGCVVGLRPHYPAW